jgi:hypothetical protein
VSFQIFFTILFSVGKDEIREELADETKVRIFEDGEINGTTIVPQRFDFDLFGITVKFCCKENLLIFQEKVVCF